MFLLLWSLLTPAVPPAPQPVNVLMPLAVQQAPVTPEPPRLEVSGPGVQVVKVDKVIIVKEDRTVVQSFPFTITAPPGAMLYNWSFNPPVQGNDLASQFEVTSAPKGPLNVIVKMVTLDLQIDWDKRTSKQVFNTNIGRTSFDVGAVSPVVIPPVKPVDPPVKPVDPPVKPVDPPVGPPVDLGKDTLGFAKMAMSEAKKVPEPYRSAKLEELASHFEAVSAKLAATGTWTIDIANADLKKRNQDSLKTNEERIAWSPFYAAYKAHADPLNANGSLRTKEQYVDVFADMAKGMRAAK